MSATIIKSVDDPAAADESFVVLVELFVESKFCPQFPALRVLYQHKKESSLVLRSFSDGDDSRSMLRARAEGAYDHQQPDHDGHSEDRDRGQASQVKASDRVRPLLWQERDTSKS